MRMCDMHVFDMHVFDVHVCAWVSVDNVYMHVYMSICGCFFAISLLGVGEEAGFSLASGLLSSTDILQTYSAKISFISNPLRTGQSLQPRALTGR